MNNLEYILKKYKIKINKPSIKNDVIRWYQNECRLYMDEYEKMKEKRKIYLFEHIFSFVSRINIHQYEFKNEKLIKTVLFIKELPKLFCRCMFRPETETKLKEENRVSKNVFGISPALKALKVIKQKEKIDTYFYNRWLRRN